MATEPAVLRGRAFLRAGRSPGRDRPRRQWCGAGHDLSECGRETLRLEARAPGTREFLRASIDYDNIEAGDEQRFNLVIQRVRSPGSERVEAQETFRDLSVDPQSPRFVTLALLESDLMRVRGDVPIDPARIGRSCRAPVCRWAMSAPIPMATMARPITDYDVIGSATRGTGLFALEAVDELAFVYIPPLARNIDVGISALLVAARFCRDKRAMLIIDPPAAWESRPRRFAPSRRSTSVVTMR